MRAVDGYETIVGLILIILARICWVPSDMTDRNISQVSKLLDQQIHITDGGCSIELSDKCVNQDVYVAFPEVFVVESSVESKHTGLHTCYIILGTTAIRIVKLLLLNFWDLKYTFIPYVTFIRSIQQE